jgi:hypothetical protein
MRLRGWVPAFLLIGAAVPLAMAQSGSAGSSDERYVPRLGDIMNNAQMRHIKLWYAGKAANWELAGFELRQLKTNLVDAALLYSGIPVTNVTTLATPLQAVSDAIEAKGRQPFCEGLWRAHRWLQCLPPVDGTCLRGHSDAGRAALRLRRSALRAARPEIAAGNGAGALGSITPWNAWPALAVDERRMRRCRP